MEFKMQLGRILLNFLSHVTSWIMTYDLNHFYFDKARNLWLEVIDIEFLTYHI